MGAKRYLDTLLSDGTFRFDRLSIAGIDNEPVARIFSDKVLEQEICLLARDIKNGDDYLTLLSTRLMQAMQNKSPLPVVRFADGEYAFYNYTLDCNGLYRQAESVSAIREAIPRHAAALHDLSLHGLLAPLVYPGNSHLRRSGLRALFGKKPDSGGADFLEFLSRQTIALTTANYVPFYATYAYLTSAAFADMMNGRHLVILNSDFNEASCRNWFARLNSRPDITFVPIPPEYVATRWDSMKKDVLSQVPPHADLCLTGAGVGALLICRDVAQTFSIPAVDAGHVLNMMNDRVDKSNGARLYTLRKGHE
ncbi:MAG: hypothetical protein R6W75_07050 [Smithellaceae bacterium]